MDIDTRTWPTDEVRFIESGYNGVWTIAHTLDPSRAWAVQFELGARAFGYLVKAEDTKKRAVHDRGYTNAHRAGDDPECSVCKAEYLDTTKEA